MCQLRVVDPTNESGPALLSAKDEVTPECEFAVTPGLKYIVTIANIFGNEESQTVNRDMNNRKNLGLFLYIVTC